MATFELTPESYLEIHATSSVHPIDTEARDIAGRVDVQITDNGIQLEPTPTGYFEFPVNQLKSGKKLEDIAMQKAIGAKKFPTIRYEVRNVTGGPDTFTVTGALTFHGVTKEFTEEIKARIENGTLYAEGEHTMDVTDYEMKPPKILTLQVHPKVRVVAHLVGKEA